MANSADRREDVITDVNADLGRANAGFRRALTGTEDAMRGPRVTGAKLSNMTAEAMMPPEVEKAYAEANKTGAEAQATREGASLAKDQVTHYRAIADDARQLAAERRQGQAQQAREAGQSGFRPRTGEDVEAILRTIEEQQGPEAARQWLQRQTGAGQPAVSPSNPAAPSATPLPAGFEQYGSAPASVAAPGANVMPMGFEQFTTAPQARPAAPSVYPAVPEFASLNRPRMPSITDPTGDRAASHAREVLRQTGGAGGAFSFNQAMTDPREIDKLNAAAGTSDRIHDDRTSDRLDAASGVGGRIRDQGTIDALNRAAGVGQVTDPAELDRLNASAGGSSRVNDGRTVDALNERAGVGSFRPGGAGAGGGLPRVNSPEEAARLPRGTRFIGSDGRVRVVP